MTTPNQKNPQQQDDNRRDRGVGQTQDDRQRNPQQGGRPQPDMPASTPRTDRDQQQQQHDPNRGRTGVGQDVETDQRDPMRKDQQNR